MTLDGLLIGVLLAFLYRARAANPDIVSPKVAPTGFWLGAAIFLAVSTTSMMMSEITWWDKTSQPLVVALGFGGMTFGLLFGGGPAPLFRSFLLFFLARISYTLYLIHFPLIPGSMALATAIAPEGSEFSFFFVIFVTWSLIAALALHYLVEKPFLLLKDRVGD